MSNAVDGNTI